MDEERKVRVAITKSDDMDQKHRRKHDLEHVLTPKNKRKSSIHKQDVMRWIKPVLFAVILGLVFGVGLMYFFSDFTSDEPSGTNDEQAIPAATDDEETETQANGQATFAMDTQQFKLIQYGLFSSESNAQDHLLELKGIIDLPAFIIQNEQNYYVVGGYLSSSEEETQSIEWLEDRGLVRLEDFLTKDWQLSQEGFQATEEELTWLESSLDFLESDSFSWESWSEWVQTMPSSLQNQLYANTLQQLTTEANEQFMNEKTVQLSLLFFFSELE